MTPKPSAAAIEAPLLPCPFCGSDSIVWSENYGRIRCNGCFIGTTGAFVPGEKARAIAAWNHRARPAAEPGLRELLKRWVDPKRGGPTLSYDAELKAATRAALAAEPGLRTIMPRAAALVGGVLMVCDELERQTPGLPTIDGKRLRDMALELRAALAATEEPNR